MCLFGLAQTRYVPRSREVVVSWDLSLMAYDLPGLSCQQLLGPTVWPAGDEIMISPACVLPLSGS